MHLLSSLTLQVLIKRHFSKTFSVPAAKLYFLFCTPKFYIVRNVILTSVLDFQRDEFKVFTCPKFVLLRIF